VESVNFDRAAEYYDATRALPDEAMTELLGILVPELAARKPCLEIGVGTGRIALPLHDQGISMAGADIAEAMLRRLVVNAKGVRPFPLLLADARRLPLAAGSFGSVLAVHVLHLIPSWQEAVDEAMRALRPGGTLIASFPGGDAATRQQARMAPWRPAVREALARHGIVRVRSGAHTPQEVGAYLGGRATARMLPPVAVPETQTLAGTLHDLERQLYSWTWSYSREQVLAASADIRAWAHRESVSLAEEHPVEGTLEWWAFDFTQ
jgi:SAM-dependent methyltransferase